LTLPNLAHALAPYIGGDVQNSGSIQSGIAGGIAGSVLRDFFGR
jgi:hypothetical protein